MLNRIRNIEPGTDFKKAGKFKRFDSAAQLIRSNFISISDSKEFSPALKFLAKHNWKLINLKFSGAESIIVSLGVGSYEISTLIDLLNITNLDFLNYDVTTQYVETGKTHSYTASFKSFLTGIKTVEEPHHADLNPLDILFERYAALRMDTELTQNDGPLIRNLSADIKKELEELFDYINKIFLTFISKLTLSKKIESFGNNKYVEQSVLLLSIKALKD